MGTFKFNEVVNVKNIRRKNENNRKKKDTRTRTPPGTFKFNELVDGEFLIGDGVGAIFCDVFLQQPALEHSTRERRHHGLVWHLAADWKPRDISISWLVKEYRD